MKFHFLVLQLLLLQPGVVNQEVEPPTLKSLVMDPYILIAAGWLENKAIEIQMTF